MLVLTYRSGSAARAEIRKAPPPLSPVAYLEADDEIGDCWRVTFAFQNESDVPFTPDHAVALFCEGDRIDDKIHLSYDDVRPWMDNDSLRKQDSPLHLLFI